MKKQFLFLLIGIPGMLSAQHTLQPELNLPRVGDELFKQQVEYKDPGRSGANVLWDFSHLTSINDSYTLDYSLAADSSTIVGTEHRTRYYYSLSGDSLLGHGYENSTTIMTNERPELLLRFPVQYGSSTFDYYSGNGKYGNRLAVSAMGTVSGKADAFGMMILPDGDTLTNVLRVHTVKKIASHSKPISFYGEEILLPVTNDSIDYRLANDTTILEVETCRWYTAGYRYPIFETVKSITNRRGQESEYFATAFFYPPQDHYYLETDPENKKIVEAQNKNKEKEIQLIEGTRFNAYPNPMYTSLDVEVYIPVEAKIRIQVRSVGSQAVYLNENKGKHAAGSYHFRFDVSHLPPTAYYLLNVWADNYMLSETIFKQ